MSKKKRKNKVIQFELSQKEEWFNKSEKNQQFLGLYLNNLENIEKIKNVAIENNKELSLHIPCVTENYENSKVKILVVGQEVGKDYFRISEPKETILKNLNMQMQPKAKKTPFFYFVRDIYNSINNCNDNKNKRSYVAWTNLRKFCYRSKPRVSLLDSIQNTIDENFNVLLEEIKIFSPDIVIFLTGPSYDKYIKKQLKDIEFLEIDNHDKRGFAKLKSSDLHSIGIKYAFRLYHPKYLYLHKLSNRFINSIKMDYYIDNPK